MTDQKEFKAFVVEETESGFVGSIQQKKTTDLPQNDIVVKVRYSSLNYKDALSASGNKGVTRSYPHTPGIDAVGTVVSSKSDKFKINDQVIVTSYDLGMNTAGGFGQYISVPAEWVVSLPAEMSMKEAMILGTAGLAAAISVFQLIKSVKPEDGKIAVSGATGGVGSLAVAILAKLGYQVSAISGKTTEKGFLAELGATEILNRSDFSDVQKRPIAKAQFAGAIDTVGGDILVNIIKSTQAMGVVTCCGNVASAELPLTVYPFIIRGISLVGIDSQNLPAHCRQGAWDKLASEWKPEILIDVFNEITLAELNENISQMLQGKLKGRTIIDLGSE